MSTIAEVQFSHEDGALAHTLRELPETGTKVIRETSTGPRQSTYFLRFDHRRSGKVRSVLENDHTVSTATPLSESEEEQMWRIEFTDDAKLLNPLVTGEDGFVLHARGSTMENDRWGWHERWLLPNHEALYTIWQQARESGFEFEILQVHPWDGTLAEYTVAQALTDEQQNALRLAYERGYFTEPREASLKDLGDELEISPSAVAGRLKRGMKLLIRETFIVNDLEQ